MRIETPTMDDLDAIVEAWVRLAEEQRDHGSHLPGEPNREAIREDVGHRIVTGDVRVARDDGLVGFVTFGMETGTYEHDRARGRVHNLYVRPEARSQGIGSRLLAAAERAMADDGVEVVLLDVMAANESARRLYRRRGYRPHRIELEKPLENDRDSKDAR